MWDHVNVITDECLLLFTESCSNQSARQGAISESDEIPLSSILICAPAADDSV